MTSLLNTVWAALPWNRGPQAPTNLQIIQKRFGNDVLVGEVVQKYFSSYADDLLPLDEPTLRLIGDVIQRKQAGTEFNGLCNTILFPVETCLASTHQEVFNEPLLHEALTSQFIFDRELLHLEKLDRYQRLAYGKIPDEIRLIERAITPKKHFWSPAEKFTDKERAYLGQISDKANEFGTRFRAQVGISLGLRKMALAELNDRIGKLRESMTTIFLDDQKRPKAAITPLNKEWMETAQNMPAMAQPSTPEIRCHPSLSAHYVIALGDPFKKEGRFIIVKRPDKIADADWAEFISPVGTRNLVDHIQKEKLLEKKPNESFFIQYANQRIEVCYEVPSEVIELHANRDVGEKTRRSVIQGGYQRQNKAVKKDPKWSLNTIATAGVDFHEAEALKHRVIALILGGQIDQIPLNICQNLVAYYRSLSTNDVSRLSGSYGADPRFIQTLGTYQYISETLEKLIYRERAVIPYLEKGEYGWKKDRARVGILSQDIFESYSGWSQHLKAFLEELSKPENQKIVEIIGNETLGQLRHFHESLNEFLAATIPPEIRQVIETRKAIHQKFDRNKKELIAQRDAILQRPEPWSEELRRIFDQIEPDIIKQDTDRAKELEPIWPQWRSNKKPDQIDDLLSNILERMKIGIQKFTPSLVQINIPFSSPARQNAIETAMAGEPELLNLYRRAIPPIWQNKAKFQMLIHGELMKGTELSPLWLQMADVMEIADQELIKNEFSCTRNKLI